MSDPNPIESIAQTTGSTNYSVAPDVFERVIQQYTPEQQETLRFWYFLGKDRNWSLARLATACGSSTTTLSRVFRGEYGADLTNLCQSLARAKANFREVVENPDFIMTSLARQAFTVCDRTRALRTVSLMIGKMGIGKTTVLQEYKRLNNHGRTIYFRCEPGLTLVQFITLLAGAAGITGRRKQTQLTTREKLYSVLGAGQRLLIIDELHELFLRRDKGDITPILQCEFLRAAFDNSGCGMVLCGTEILEKHMVNQGEALAQLMDRGTMKIQLPGKPTRNDTKAFIKAYGLPELDAEKQPEAAAIVGEILQASGLRKLTLHLRDGAATAAKRTEKYTWNHFVTAFDDLASLGKRPAA